MASVRLGGKVSDKSVIDTYQTIIGGRRAEWMHNLDLIYGTGGSPDCLEEANGLGLTH